MLFLVLTFIVLLSISYWIYNCYTFWSRLNIPTPPISLFFGNVKEAIFLRKNFSEIIKEAYNDFEGLLYVGFYKLTTPCFVVRDLDLAKKILVEDFTSFHDNDIEFDPKIDPLFSRNPFVLNGQAWKTGRSQLAPNFTKSKMKAVFSIVQEKSNNLSRYIEKHKTAIDIKERAKDYTSENVFGCGFGIDAKSFEDEDNEFKKLGKNFAEISDMDAFFVNLALLSPSFGKLFKVKMFSDYLKTYFLCLIDQLTKYRKQNSIYRNDFFDNLIKLQEKNANITNLDLAGHALSLFIDGFETSASGIVFVLYLLAKHQDVQEKLRKDIQEILSTKTTVEFEDVMDLPYLEAVVKEALRLYPPLPFMLKRCTQDIILPHAVPGKNKTVNIPKGTIAIFPTFAIHYDKNNFEEPTRFKPERFLDISNINEYAWLAFGAGPRICIGMRFGLLQVKMAVFNLISQFRVKLNPKTPEVLEVDPKAWLLALKTNILLDFDKL